MYTVPTFSTVVTSVCPFQLLSPLLRHSFNRGHSRFCHTHSRANGLQSAPKYWICIYFPFQRGSASRAPFDLPQNPTGFKQEPGAGFLTSVRATSLGRHETTRLALRAFHRKGNKAVATLNLQAKELRRAIRNIILSLLINPILYTVSDYCQSFQLISN